MAGSSPRRYAATARPLGVVLTTLLLLAACTSAAETAGKAEATSAEVPELGACRVLEPDDLTEPTNTDEKVDCSEPHTAETFAVGPFPESFATVAYDDDRVGAHVYDTCSKAFMKFLGADESLVLRSLLSWAWFRPTREAWEQGARWYRCDVVGEDEQGDALLELPETAQGLMLGTGDDRYLACVAGDTVPGAPRIPCTEPHDWRAVTTIKLGDAKDDYPGDRVVEVRTRDFCDESVRAWLGYPLEYTFAYTWFHEAEWEAGNRRSICWARTTE